MAQTATGIASAFVFCRAMPRSAFLLLFIFLCLGANAQQVIVGDSMLTPATGALLDVRSVTQGVRLPMLTTVQRNAIAQPAKALLLFNTDSNYFEANFGTPELPNWQPLFYQSNLAANQYVLLGGNNIETGVLKIGTQSSSVLQLITADSVRIAVDSLQNRVGLFTKTPRSSLDIQASDAIIVPSGTTAQRPVTPVAGMIRFNQTTQKLEGYTPEGWKALHQ